MIKMQKLWNEPIFWLASLTGGFSAVLTNIPLVINVLMCMMAIDILAGLLTAAIAGKINRKRMFQGAMRKIIMLLVVSAAALVQLVMDVLLRTSFSTLFAGVPTNIPLSEFVGGVFIVYELISILENATKAGVRLPQPLVRILEAGQPHPKAGE